MILRLFSVLLLALTSMTSGWAHDPNLASFRVYPEHGRWLMRIDLATPALTYMPGFSPRLTAATDAFKAEIVRYLKENIRLVLDETAEVELSSGGIKFGDHATEAIFLLDGLSADWTTLEAEISCFEANEKHRNLLRVEGTTQTFKVFLDHSNDFVTTFEQVSVEIRPNR